MQHVHTHARQLNLRTSRSQLAKQIVVAISQQIGEPAHLELVCVQTQNFVHVISLENICVSQPGERYNEKCTGVHTPSEEIGAHAQR